jgi:hypothetical protein
MILSSSSPTTFVNSLITTVRTDAEIGDTEHAVPSADTLSPINVRKDLG